MSEEQKLSQKSLSQDNESEDIEGVDCDDNSDAWEEYPLDSVFIREEKRTARELVNRIEKGRFILDPDFQRDFLWNQKQQSKLIESCLMRIPLPVMYLAQNEDGKTVVVDGLQRLTTFTRFLNDDFSLVGVGGNDERITNKKFSQLPINLQERIEDTQLTLFILDEKAPERAKLDVFERVNGGVPLSRQQMRNCLYSGPATRWLKEVAESEIFIRATGNSFNSKLMRNREAINRFCAFYLLGYESYKGDMDSFLAEALSKMNQMDESDLQEMMKAFSMSLELNYQFFGKHAFRKSMFYSSTSRTVINVSLFDAYVSEFALHLKTLGELNRDYFEGILKFISKRSLLEDSVTLSTNSLDNVRYRHRALASIFDIPEFDSPLTAAFCYVFLMQTNKMLEDGELIKTLIGLLIKSGLLGNGLLVSGNYEQLRRKFEDSVTNNDILEVLCKLSDYKLRMLFINTMELTTIFKEE